MWRRVAPDLAREFTVVATDLRGYGASGKPATGPDHEPYSKRAMARDQLAVMRRLGFERFCVAGHDRGARCAYRLALDHPAHVRKLAVLDVIPTGDAFRGADMAFGLGFWPWFFLAQPADRLPDPCPLERPRGAGAPVRRARHLARVGGRRPRPGARLRALPAREGARGDLRGAAGVLRRLKDSPGRRRARLRHPGVGPPAPLDRGHPSRVVPGEGIEPSPTRRPSGF
jgi:pimeloyl-ACP methyl ester carboxylesterase